MLEKLVINNVALIQRAEIEFGEGLNVLSGETGSGKSVILDSINFVLGAKADRSMIRHGENECSVFALFRIGKDSAAYEAMDTIGIEPDEEIVISRKYRADGRGDIRLNGSPLNAGCCAESRRILSTYTGKANIFISLTRRISSLCWTRRPVRR